MTTNVQMSRLYYRKWEANERFWKRVGYRWLSNFKKMLNRYCRFVPSFFDFGEISSLYIVAIISHIRPQWARLCKWRMSSELAQESFEQSKNLLTISHVFWHYNRSFINQHDDSKFGVPSSSLSVRWWLVKGSCVYI